ncbi:MAG: helix-turn-helix domain-containing protein [Desulfotomaculum sp.]|nr:helix-turn-helix domain-containing protein [Desulfotomaculum sp.]
MSQAQDKKHENYPRLMTIPEVAKILRIGEARAYEYARQRIFPVFYLGRRVRVPTKQFFEWLDQQADRG